MRRGDPVSAGVIGLVLASAVMHAAWNALLKGGDDRLRSVTVMGLVTSAAGAAVVGFLPMPRVESWIYLGLSAVLHVGYNMLLVRSYRDGDLGVAYPIAGGSSRMLVRLAAAVVAGERLDGAAMLGVGVISLGILALAREGRRGLSARSWLPAIQTGVAIAAYTVVDGLGSRRSGDARSYAAWLFLLFGAPMPLILVARRGRAGAFKIDAAALRSAMGGLVSMVAYAIVIWAASISPMGEVSALRETSVVFAALFGRMFLGERLGWRRLASCLVVAAGAACLGYHGR